GMTLDDLFRLLETMILPRTKDLVSQQLAVAQRHGVQLVAYEGGQSLVGVGPLGSDPAINALFDAANRDPRMGALYTRYFADWGDAGGQLFMHFTNCASYNR